MLADRAAYAFRTLVLLVAASLVMANVTANAEADTNSSNRTGDSIAKGCEDRAAPAPEVRQGSGELQQQPSTDHTQLPLDDSKESSILTEIDRQIQAENDRIKRKLIICRHC